MLAGRVILHDRPSKRYVHIQEQQVQMLCDTDNSIPAYIDLTSGIADK